MSSDETVSWDGPPQDDERGPGTDQLLARELARHLLVSLFSLLRTGSIHDINNRAFERPVRAVQESVRELIELLDGPISAVCSEAQLYINQVRVPVPERQFQIVRELQISFEDKDVGGITFTSVPTDIELRQFGYLFHRLSVPDSVGGHSALETALKQVGIESIGAVPPVQLRVGAHTRESVTSPRVEATLAYAKAVTAMSMLMADPSGKEVLTEAHLRRIVHQIADCAGEALDYLVGLTEAAQDIQSIPRVLVDTCVVAVAVARSMQLDRVLISDLGAAALQLWAESHDREDWADERPLAVLAELATANEWTASTLRRILVAAQRHQPVRASAGLPAQHPLARIYRAAYDFVAFTHGLAFTQDGVALPRLTAYEALTFIAQSPPHEYDQMVVRHLVRVVGLYPTGTLVLLTDGREGFVVQRTTAGDHIVRLRLGNGKLGDLVVVDGTNLSVGGVLNDADAAERAAALLSDVDRDAILDETEQFGRATLARVTLKRLAHKSKKPREG